jgi:uncharacterized protein YcbK (DUF882 family)
MTPPTRPDRRRFLLLGAAAAGAALCPLPRRAVAEPSVPAVQAGGRALTRWIELVNTHTSESLQLAYRDASGLIGGSLDKLQWLLRDHRANEAGRIDPELFDWLADAAAKLGVEPRYQVISGYRSSRTNEMLRRTGGGGVARKSFHMQGRAIDVRLHGADCAALRDVAVASARGGVGYYRRSAFVHLDTGAVRAWAG